MGKKSAKVRQQEKAGIATSKEATVVPPDSTFVTLDDGTELPVGRPAGVTDEQYARIIQHLKENPEIARQQAEKAQQLMGNPMMAQAMMAQQKMMADPSFAKGMAALKDDPEFKQMFDEIKEKGPEALSKYWDDTDVMSKISKKMMELKMANNGPSTADKEQQGPREVKAVTVESIHDAAKVGDVQVLMRFIDSDSKLVDSKDGRGITPLGVAVGFNRLDAIKTLLASGANPNLTDSQGNTPLHYACGYGRKEAAELLLDAGVDPAVANKAGQTAFAVAQLNKETGIVKFMQERGLGGAAAGEPAQDAFL